MIRLITIVSLVLCPALVSAQPLADRVPDDAIVYIGWAGTRTLGDGYEQSHLKAVVDASNLRELFSDFIPAAVAKLNEKDPGGGPQVLEMVSAIGGRMWRHPTAIAFGGIDATDPKRRLPRLVVMVDAGNESDALLEDLQSLMAQLPPEPGMPQAKKVDDIVVISTLDYATDAADALAASQQFTRAIEQVQKSSALSIYVDIEAALKLVDETVASEGDAEAQANWPRVRDALNLRGLKRLAVTSGFDGREWGYRAFIEAPAPRSGILSLFDGKPISDDTLKLIPAGAIMAGAGHFDAAALVEQIRSSGEKIDPKFAGQLGMAMGMLDGLLGMDVENDLLEPLGSEWASYVAPHIGGEGLLGTTLVNRLDDAAKAEAALNQLSAGFNNAVRNQLQDQEITIEIRQEKLPDGTQMHFLATPLITPAWAVKNGSLHVALFPQVLAAAVTHTPGKDPSILDNEKFMALRKRLETPAVTSLQFTDLQATVPNGYGTWLLVSRYIGMADIFGIKSPAMLIPPMHVLQQHLTPAGAVAWTDDAGWHMRGTSPFPGSETLGTDPVSSMMAGQPALMFSILLPSLNRARETANRVKCASNQKQIGQALLLYANENRGKYPQNMGELLKTQDLTIDVFMCPSSNTSLPPDVGAGGVEAMAEWINEGNSDYIYNGAGKNNAAGPDEIIVYEKPHNHDHEEMNMLFGNGRVEFNQMPQVHEMFQEQNIPVPD